MGVIYKNGIPYAGGGEGNNIQVASLPSPSAVELGAIYQYIGTTTATRQNGCFYKCILDSSTGDYIWTAIQVEAKETFETDPIDWTDF